MKQKEHYSGFAARALGDYYSKAHLYKEGIADLAAIRQKYPGSMTAHVALAQIFNLQMKSGDSVAATATRQQIVSEVQQNSTYKIGSEDVLQNWDAVKKGAVSHRDD